MTAWDGRRCKELFLEIVTGCWCLRKSDCEAAVLCVCGGDSEWREALGDSMLLDSSLSYQVSWVMLPSSGLLINTHFSTTATKSSWRNCFE